MKPPPVDWKVRNGLAVERYIGCIRGRFNDGGLDDHESCRANTRSADLSYKTRSTNSFSFKPVSNSSPLIDELLVTHWQTRLKLFLKKLMRTPGGFLSQTPANSVLSGYRAWAFLTPRKRMWVRSSKSLSRYIGSSFCACGILLVVDRILHAIMSGQNPRSIRIRYLPEGTGFQIDTSTQRNEISELDDFQTDTQKLDVSISIAASP